MTATQPSTSRTRSLPRPFIWIGIALALIILAMVTILRIYTTPHSTSTHAGNTTVQQPAHGPVAVITDSGSTNTPGSTLTINNDGSGSLHYILGKHTYFQNYKDRTFPASTFDSTKLSQLLARIQDVSTIPNHSCLKSISFGTSMTITYHGKTSGDLSCLSGNDSQDFGTLKALTKQFYNQAKHPKK